jgi:hypothetical protein
MNPRTRRFLLFVFFVLFQLQLVSHGKAPKKTEAEGLTYATFPGQPIPAKPLLDMLVREERWDNGGLRVGDSQGLNLRFIKVDDQAAQNGSLARYRVFAAGAPENKVYAWRTWQDGEEPKSAPQDIYVNARGLLMTHKPLPEEESSLQVPGGELDIAPEAHLAEPFRYDIFSRDNQFSIPGTLVPRPMASVDHGCRLEARIAQPNASAVLIVSDGLPMESKIPLVLESEGATTTLQMATDSAGHAIVAVFPDIPGKTQGVLRATVEGSDCLPSVSLPWGSDDRAAQKTP